MQKCTHNVWRENNGIEITHSIIHYLYAIDFLHKANGYSRAVDIANHLGITAGSCSIGLKNLLKKGFVKEDENRFISLTSLGQEIVEKSFFKRNIILSFFEKKLGINHQKAEINACNIEHLLDDEIIEKLQKYV